MTVNTDGHFHTSEPGADDPIEAWKRRYIAATHAMQTGVAYVMHGTQGRAETDPKHLRVGVNNALVQQSAVVKLLFSKGIITELEYWEAVATAMEEEAERYRLVLQKSFHGVPVDLR